VEVQGRARAEFFIDTGFPLADGFPFEVVLSVRDAAIKFSQLPIHLSRVNGLFEVNRKRLKWSKVNFLYDGENCSSEGLLDNFENPAVDIKLRSKNIELISIFNRKGNLVNLSKLQFRFRGSNISSSGTFNLSNPGAIDANLKVTASADLKDIGPILKIPESTMLILKPSGIIDIRGDISGDIRDLKTCLVDARIKSNSFSFYGLKAQRLNLVYFQKDGLAELKDSRLGFYEGSIEFGMRLNVGARSLPFAAQAIIDGVKLENIGNDIKGAEDLAGTVKLNAELNGFLNDISTLSGSGDIFISNGRIWELNLFKGIGKLVFTKNYFAKIIFKEGAASFVIADKTVNCEKVNLKGDIANLEGSVKIGLDGSLNAVLNVEVLDDMVPLTGSFKDVTTAIMGEAGRFGVIRITGTLKEPKYKFRPAVVDIIKGIKNTFFGE